MESATVTVREQLNTLNRVLPLVHAKKHESENACAEVVKEVKRLGKIIRPWGFFSTLKQKIMRLLGKDPYSGEQEVALSDLRTVLSRFLIWFNGQQTLPNADIAGFLVE